MIEGRLWHGALPGSSVPIYFIEQAEYFERDDPLAKRGIYQFADSAGQMTDYPDNAARFGFFARGVLEAMRLLNYWPDVLHLHDWQTALAAVYLRETYQRFGKPLLRGNYERMRTLFTIHNLAYQGIFAPDCVPMLGFPWRLFTMDLLEFYGKLNLLKAGIVYADRLTTVSPTYAHEIQTTMFGCGLHGVLLQRERQLHGIVNGIDDRVWNPATDSQIAAKYDATTLADGKARCKAALQKHFNLDAQPRTPLLGIVSRLAVQKGFDLIEKVIPDFVRQGVQLAVLGDGDKVYRDMLLNLAQDFPRQVGVHVGYSDPIAHQIEAGADIFLMPSQYEPCGLNQLYSLKYGTIPVVRRTGGLADTVVDATPEAIALGRATGFVFVPPSPAAFAEALGRCLAMYRDNVYSWKQLQQTGMAQDWSWRRSAEEYERLYHLAISEFL
jgi:starch synthase